MSYFKMNLKIIAMLVALGCGQLGFAETFEPVEKLKNIATTFILNNVTVNADESIDIQITKTDLPSQLPVCSQGIEASLPNDANKERISAVKLTCNGSQTWYTFIPVDVQVLTNVLVSKRTIMPKEVITEGDLEFVKSNKNRLYCGYFKKIEEAVGMEASQLITAGSVLTKRNVQQPILVHRNGTVELSVKKNSMVVSIKAIAKSDGRLNDSIQVVNPSSKKIIDAVVVGSNQVEVT